MITSCAALPTAKIAQDENKNTTIDPNSPPMKIGGFDISMTMGNAGFAVFTSSKYAENIRKQASDALPTEYPFVLAFVTFPTASNLSVMTRICPSCYDISAIPPALSAIGPNPLMLSTNTPVENIPIVATAVANNPTCRR